MEFTAEVAIHTARPLTAEQLEELAEIGGVATGTPGERRAEATFTVRAATMPDAARVALERVASIVRGKPLAVRVMTLDEADRQSDLARMPELAGVTELTTMLGITKQRIAVLRKRPDFPAPVAELASGPVWRAADLSTFAAGWQRRPGRPRKVAAAAAQ